jgi:hypothetical protein
MRNKPLQLFCLAMVAAAGLRAATIAEDFSTDPLRRGWGIFGDTNLFHWNATNQNLEVTWDSSHTNSYFQLSLGTILSKSDDFTLAFDLRMSDMAIGTSTNKPDTFEIAIGFLNSMSSTNTNYFRGTGASSIYGVRNAVEFDYFPPTALIEATFAPTVISSNIAFKFSDNRLLLTTNDLFQITMAYAASNQVFKTAVTRNGAPFGNAPDNTLKDISLVGHPDFRVDRVAIINYSDALQTGSTQFWGSIRAHGVVDNLRVTVSDPPVSELVGVKSNTTWRTTFVTRSNWSYALERSSDFLAWNVVSPTNGGTGSTFLLQDTNMPSDGAFYRVKAMRP